MNSEYTSANPLSTLDFPVVPVNTTHSWDDIVLNDELKERLNDIKNWMRYQVKIQSAHGYKTLFFGPPGTGKTITAAVLGRELGKEVYKIDLSMVVSKYIGETEKNLETLFSRAEEKGWILFFDEADALFGKRTEVSDAHDRYANQEISYLVQRIEDYKGLVILASNLKGNIDDPFVRRLNSILEFPMPTAEERLILWEKAFPSNSELKGSDEKEVPDIHQLALKYELSGGNIANIVQYAGSRALKKLEEQKSDSEINTSDSADPKIALDYTDLIEGIKNELAKEGKLLPE